MHTCNGEPFVCDMEFTKPVEGTKLTNTPCNMEDWVWRMMKVSLSWPALQRVGMVTVALLPGSHNRDINVERAHIRIKCDYFPNIRVRAAYLLQDARSSWTAGLTDFCTHDGYRSVSVDLSWLYMQGREMLQEVIDKLRELDKDYQYNFDTMPRVGVRWLGRLLPDAKWVPCLTLPTPPAVGRRRHLCEQTPRNSNFLRKMIIHIHKLVPTWNFAAKSPLHGCCSCPQEAGRSSSHLDKESEGVCWWAHFSRTSLALYLIVVHLFLLRRIESSRDCILILACVLSAWNFISSLSSWLLYFLSKLLSFAFSSQTRMLVSIRHRARLGNFWPWWCRRVTFKFQVRKCCFRFLEMFQNYTKDGDRLNSEMFVALPLQTDLEKDHPFTTALRTLGGSHDGISAEGNKLKLLVYSVRYTSTCMVGNPIYSC